MAEETAASESQQQSETQELGDAGKKALEEERTARKEADKARKAAESRLSELEKRLGEYEEASKSETEKALEKARAEATEQARKEATAAFNGRLVQAEVKAAAGGRLADPADAVRLLDLDEFSVSEGGEVDTKAVSKAIDQLLKDKPYLAAKAASANGSADGGARSANTPDVSPGLGRLRHAYSNQPK